MNRCLNLCVVWLFLALVGEIFAVDCVQASESSCDVVEKQPQDHFCRAAPSIEAKVGYFFFASSQMRAIYNQGGVDVQLSGAYPVWRGLQIYGSVEWLQRSGHSIPIYEKTSIWEIPVNVGLKPVITICPWAAWYFALGPRYFYVHQHNDSSYVERNNGKSGLGFFVNTGFDFTVWKHFLIDIFGEYSYERIHFHTSETGVYTKGMQVGGFTFGGGLGGAF